MEQLKIALVNPYKLSQPGGIREHVLALTREFRKRGHQVTVITPGESERSPIEGVEMFGRGVALSTLNGSKAMLSLYNEAIWEPVENFLHREQFDIIHIHSPEIPFLNWQILYAAEVPIVATFHSDYEWGILSDLVHRSLIRPITYFLRTKVDGSIAVSETARKFVKSCFRQGDRVIPNGVDTKRFYPSGNKEPSDTIRILFVGRLEERKGLLYLIEAFSRLKQAKLELVVVGDGPQRSEAEEFVRKRHCQESVRFLGRVSDQELPAYYRQAEIFCSPAVGGESQGIVLLEAMASGLPLVVFANPGYQELLRDYPHQESLVRPHDVDELTKALNSLVKDPELRSDLGAWGRQKALEYDWEKIVDRVLEFYHVVRKRHKDKKADREFVDTIMIPLQRKLDEVISERRDRISLTELTDRLRNNGLWERE